MTKLYRPGFQANHLERDLEAFESSPLFPSLGSGIPLTQSTLVNVGIVDTLGKAQMMLKRWRAEGVGHKSSTVAGAHGTVLLSAENVRARIAFLREESVRLESERRGRERAKKQQQRVSAEPEQREIALTSGAVVPVVDQHKRIADALEALVEMERNRVVLHNETVELVEANAERHREHERARWAHEREQREHEERIRVSADWREQGVRERDERKRANGRTSQRDLNV